MTALTWILLFISFLFNPLFADPVICIHGFMRNSKCMRVLEKELQDMGHDPHLFDYPSRKKTIEGHAEDLVQLLQGYERPPHFITHSLGGLILRAALNHPACPEKVKGGKIIMLAPPNRGSRTAHLCGHLLPLRALFGNYAGNQLIHFKQTDVEALGELPFCTIIAGNRDWKVTIQETKPQSPHSQYIIKSGHCFIMSNRRTLEIIRKILCYEQKS